jgi:hypothetical protein
MMPPALRPLSLGEILDLSFTLYRRHFGPLAVVVLVCSAAPFVLGLYLVAAGGMLSNLPLLLCYILLFVVLSSVATAATVYIVSESYLGTGLSAAEALARAAPLLGQVVLCSVLFGLAVGLGFLLLIVPGVVLLCGLVLSTPALVLEPGSTATDALRRSWVLTRGSKWRIFALLATVTVLVYLPSTAVEGIVTLFLPAPAGSGQPAAASWLLRPLLSGLVQMFVYPLFNCVLTVAYYDLRVRKEGFDLEVLASTLQPA